MNADAFWTRIEMFGDCWLWKGAIDTRGYGHLRLDGKNRRAHRVAYELANGPIQKRGGHHGTVVMHTCDNRLCCKPSHLRLADHATNMADMKAKGRRKGINTGVANGRAKLRMAQVAAIRLDKRGKRTIAPEYGISPAQVQRIRNGANWA